MKMKMIFSIPKPSPKLPEQNQPNVSIAKTVVPPTVSDETKILTKILNSEKSTFMMLRNIDNSKSSCCGGYKA